MNDPNTLRNTPASEKCDAGVQSCAMRQAAPPLSLAISPRYQGMAPFLTPRMFFVSTFLIRTFSGVTSTSSSEAM